MFMMILELSTVSYIEYSVFEQKICCVVLTYAITSVVDIILILLIRYYT